MRLLTLLLQLTLVAASIRPPYCGNKGTQYSAYTENTGESDDDFNPNYINGRRHLFAPRVWKNYTGIYIGFTSGTFWNEAKPVPNQNLVVNQIGYIYAPYTGTYSFNVTSVDDAIWFWFGKYAYSGFSSDNANFYTSLEHYYPESYEYNMVAGQYYAYRMVYLNTDGSGHFNLTIDTPHGTPLSTNQFVYFGCDGAAPIFPDYNSTATTS